MPSTHAGKGPGATVDGDAAPMALEQGLMGGGGGGGEPPPLPTTTYLSREYVWGPGDGGIDELLVHYDPSRLPSWSVQDGGGDIVALVAYNGGNPVVAAQWTYDAYGAVLTAQEFSAVPRLHCGHKGLFLDRLDVGVGSGGSEPPRLVPYAHCVYQNRNRAYAPALGRFYLLPITPPIPYTLAKAIETVLIMSNPHFENRILSIGRNNPVFNAAVHAGTSWLLRNGRQFVY